MASVSSAASATTGAGAAALRALAIGLRLPSIAVGLAVSGLFVLAGARSLGLAWPITNPEGAILAAVLRIRDGEPLYQDFRQYPYLITPYPPLQLVASGLVSRVLGLDVLGTLAVARGLTLAASVACAVLIGLVARAAGAGPLVALAGAVMFLPLPFLDAWGFALRPDTPSLALTLLAGLLLLSRPDRPWLAAAVSVLAFFTKQTSLAFPVAATLWLLLQGRRRAAATFAGAWLALAAGGLGILEGLTGGQYVANTVVAHLGTPKNGFDLALRDLRPLFEIGWLPLGLAALAAGLELAARRRPSLLTLYVLASLAVTLATLRNSGSDVNYLIEPAAAACALAALAIDRAWRGLDRGAPAGVVAAAALAVAGPLWGLPLWDFWRHEGGVRVLGRLPIEEIARAERVLSQEPLAVLLAGRPLVVSDTFQVSQLVDTRAFDARDLERRIKRSEFDLIILSSDVSATRWWKRVPIFPEPLRVAVKDVYVSAGRVGPYWLYVPEDRRPGRAR